MEKSAGWRVMSACLRAGWKVHENSAEAEEINGSERLGKEVGDVVGCADVWDGDGSVLNEFADPEMSAVDVLGPVVVLGIVGEVASDFVVGGLDGGAGGWET